MIDQSGETYLMIPIHDILVEAFEFAWKAHPLVW